MNLNLYLNDEWMITQLSLTIPLGPSVLLMRSPIAIAPTNDERRATSDFSSSAFCFRI